MPEKACSAQAMMAAAASATCRYANFFWGLTQLLDFGCITSWAGMLSFLFVSAYRLRLDF
jgi:hypothetical protein